MWLPLQLAAEMTCTCFPLLCMYLLLAQINNNNINAHFGYVHHLNNKHRLVEYCNRKSRDFSLPTSDTVNE